MPSKPIMNCGAKVAVLYSEAHASATSLPMHPHRNAIAWDLIAHYALGHSDNVPNRPDADTGAGDDAQCHATEPRLPAVVQLIRPAPLGPKAATSDLLAALKEFHAPDYVAFILGRERQSNVDVRAPAASTESVHKRAREGEEASGGSPPSHRHHDLIPIPDDAGWGCVSECHPFVGMAHTALSIVHGTLTAVDCMAPTLHQKEGCAAVDADGALPSGGGAVPSWCAMHWWGGRHHAHADKASGFCLFNDVVLGVQRLQQRLRHIVSSDGRSRKPRVLVVDVDAHHGDGTQEAFYHDPSVCTLSSHRVGLGVYPGTGLRSERGEGFGREATCNVPLPEGCCGSVATPLIVEAIDQMWALFRPDAVVVVCGADALQGDPLGGLNFGIGDLQAIVRHVVRRCVAAAPTARTPLLVLGAGGYVDTSYAKMAAAVTRDIVDATAWLQRQDDGSSASRNSPTARASGLEPDLFGAPLLSLRRGWSRPPAAEDALSLPLHVPVPEGCQHFGLYRPTFCMEDLPAPVFPRVASLCAWDPEALLRGTVDASDADETATTDNEGDEEEASAEEEEERSSDTP